MMTDPATEPLNKTQARKEDQVNDPLKRSDVYPSWVIDTVETKMKLVIDSFDDMLEQVNKFHLDGTITPNLLAEMLSSLSASVLTLLRVQEELLREMVQEP